MTKDDSTPPAPEKNGKAPAQKPAGDPLADIPIQEEPIRPDGSHRGSPPMAERTVLVQITSKTPVSIHSGRAVYPHKTKCSPDEARSLIAQGLAVRLPGV